MVRSYNVPCYSLAFSILACVAAPALHAIVLRVVLDPGDNRSGGHGALVRRPPHDAAVVQAPVVVVIGEVLPPAVEDVTGRTELDASALGLPTVL